MSITFPLATSEFFDVLRPKGGFFNPSFGKEYSEGGDGTFYDKDLRPALWQADFETIDQPHNAIKQLQASINSMGESSYTFYAYDPILKYPQADPTGSVLGASTVSIRALSTGVLGLKGLPAGYHLTKADMLSFQYGSSPVYQALHQLSVNVTADGSGNTTLFTVFPPVRDGAAVDAPVTLIKAVCIMKIRPGTVKYSVSNRMKSNLSFSAVQQLTP